MLNIRRLLILLFPILVFSLSFEEIQKAYKQSYLYEKIGDYKNAIRVLMPVYKTYPNGYTVNLRLGWLYYLAGNYKNSEYHYGKAERVAPYAVEPKLGLSLPLIAQHRWHDAEQILYRVIGLDFYNYYGNLRLCKVLQEEGKYNEQLAIALKMLYIYPTGVPFLLEEGKAYYYLGKYHLAEKVFKNVLILDPENLTAKEFLKKIKQHREPLENKTLKKKENG